jgi:hypothetical protein
MTNPASRFAVEWTLFDTGKNPFKRDLTSAVPDYLGDDRGAGDHWFRVFVGADKASDRCSLASFNRDERAGIEDESHHAERLAGRAAGTSASSSSRDQPCSARISSRAVPRAAWRSLWRIAVASHAETFVFSA